MNRIAATLITSSLRRLPRLEQFVAAHVDARRLELALARYGGAVQTVYDIGAHRGAWTRAARRAIPGGTFVLFEGNATHATALRATGGRLVVGVLGAEEAEVDWYASGSPGDSYRRELTPEYADVVPTRIRTTTLDRVIEVERLPLPDLLKVDVQGTELDVLTGGRRALAHASLVLLECPILPYNEDAPTIDEYFAFMDAAGFGVADFIGSQARDGRMIHVDVLFVRLPVPAR